jgi:uncharacterized protein YdaU (DUF1376 family)
MSFYVGDYLRDTMHLTRDQHGAYLLLIFACWTNGGKLPNDDKVLASIAKATWQEWVLLKPIMAKFFKSSGHHWHQKRVDKELQKVERIHQVRKNAGKNGAAKRWQKPSQNDGSRARDSTATATTMKNPPSTTPLPIGAASDERRRPTRLPVDWQPDGADRDFAGELGLNAGEVAAEFRDYWSAIAGRKATRLDWHATFRNACRLYASRYRGSNGIERSGKHRQAGASFTAAIRRAFAEARDEGMA